MYLGWLSFHLHKHEPINIIDLEVPKKHRKKQETGTRHRLVDGWETLGSSKRSPLNTEYFSAIWVSQTLRFSLPHNHWIAYKSLIFENDGKWPFIVSFPIKTCDFPIRYVSH